jgi:ADP-heptose:LPS heptosyltransferase
MESNSDRAKQEFINGINSYNGKDYLSAENSFLKSLELSPGRLSIIGNLIKVYVVTKQHKKLNEILKDYEFDNNPNVVFGKAFSFYFNKDYQKSINLCHQLIIYKDLKYPIQDLLASNYKKLNNFVESLKVYKMKLLENKNDFKIYYNIACLFFELGKIYKASFYFEKSKKLNSTDADINWRLSLCKICLEDFEEGFKLYENRWVRKNHPKKKFSEINFPKTISDLKNKRILIWDEQGLGDTLQFSRFVIDLEKFTKNITFVVSKKLYPILKNLSSNVDVKNYDEINQSNFDYQIPVCSLPMFLNVFKKEEIKFYRLKIKENNDLKKIFRSKNFKIGIALSGNPYYPMDKYRSIPFKNFEPLLKIKNVEFYNLSNNKNEEENFNKNINQNCFNFGDKSLLEIAQLMNNLDLIVSCDSSIIHLAGILDLKSFLLLNHNADWRWLGESKKTIWYPSVEIIKQNKFNSWDFVFKNLISIIQKKRAE